MRSQNEAISRLRSMDFGEQIKYLEGLNTPFSGMPQVEKEKWIQSASDESLYKLLTSSVTKEVAFDPAETIQKSDLMRRKIAEVARPTLEIGGLVAGGLLGNLPGTGPGYAAGKQGANILEEMLGLRKPKPVGEQFIETGRDVAEGYAYEMGGRIIGAAVGKMVEAPFNITGKRAETARARHLKNLFEKYDIDDYTASDILEFKPVSLFESLAEKGLVTSGMVQEKRLNSIRQLMQLKSRLSQSAATQEDLAVVGNMIRNETDEFINNAKLTRDVRLEDIRNNIVKSLGSSETYEEIGKGALRGLAGKSGELFAKSQKGYNEIARLIPPGETVPVPTLTKTAQSIYNRLTSSPPSARNRDLMRILSDYMPTKDIPLIGGQSPEVVARTNPELYRQVVAQMESKGYSWEGLQIARGKFRDLINKADPAYGMGQPDVKGLGKTEGMFLKQMKKALDEDMAIFAKKRGGEVWSEYEFVTAMYREFKTTYDNEVIKRIMKTNADMITTRLTNPNHAMEIDFIKNAIGEKEFNETLKPGITNRLLGVGKDEIFAPVKVTSRLTTMGDEALRKIYTAQEINQLKYNIAQGLDMSKEELAPRFLETISRSHPDTIVNQIITGPNAKYTVRNVDLIKKHVKTETFEQLRGIFTDRLFEAEAKTGLMSPIKYGSKIKNYEQVLPKFYNPQEIQFLKELSEAANAMQSAERIAANPSGTGQIIVAASQLGLILRGLYGVVTGDPGKAAESFAVVLTPAALTKLYLSNAGRKFLLQGTKTFGGTRQAAALAAKIIAIAGKENVMSVNDAMKQVNKALKEE